jgi:hypothetical protein
MKLKNKVISTVFGVIASSLVFIAVPVSANAGDCSATDPCMTYAMVDGSGNVTNVIVCQPSVCGPGGELNGTIDGNKLVPQVAANPVTHDTYGTTGRMTNTVENQVVTLSQDNVFTVKRDEVVIQKIVQPEVEIKTTETSTTITTTSIDASFGNTNVITKDGQEILVTNPDFVKIDATQIISSKSTIPGVTSTNTNITNILVIWHNTNITIIIAIWHTTNITNIILILHNTHIATSY